MCVYIQEVICDVAPTEIENNNMWETSDGVENYNEDKCYEFKSKIWENAFNSQEAMKLMEIIFASAELGSTDEVCSDTFRTFLNLVTVLSTNPNAIYTVHRFKKLMWTIMGELDTTSENFAVTKRVVERIIEDEKVRDLTINSFDRFMKLISESEIRGRLLILLKGVMSLGSPSKNVGQVRQTFQQVQNGITNPNGMLKGVMNRVGSFGKRKSLFY